MAKINGITKLTNKVHRNGFDLSRKNAFTAKVGELLPVMVEEVIPGDRFDIRPEWFTRTMPVNSAAYTRIKEYYDFFFVPYRLLWRWFPQFITNVPSVQSATTSSYSPSVSYGSGVYQPYFSSADVNTFLNWTATNKKTDELGYSFKDKALKLCSYLGYGVNFKTGSFAGARSIGVNPFPLLAYQKIYADYFRFDQWEKFIVQSFNVDFILGTTQVSAKIPLSQYQNTMSFPSSNYFTLRYCNWNKDLFMGVLPSPQYGDESVAPVSISAGIADAVVSGSMYGSKKLDDDGAPILLNDSAKMGDVTVSGQAANRYFLTRGSDLSTATVNSLSGFFDLDLQDLTDNSALVGELPVLALRKAEAAQKFKEITQSQRYNYPDQISAHFGVKPSRLLGNLCEFVGGVSNNLQIGEVVNNNLVADESGQAYIQGKGVGSGNGHVKFEAKEHGIFMCIYHAVPLLDYSCRSMSPLALKTQREDYAIPEFDSIGMQQVRTINLTDTTGENAKLGWTTRYYDYKTKIDEIHGEFINTLGQWVAPLDDDYFKKHLNGNGEVKDYTFFKVDPSVLNSIFKQAADATTTSDNLLVNCQFNFKAVRNLDFNGLPY